VTEPGLVSLRILAVVHMIVGLLLLPFSFIFGLLFAPFLAAGPLWLVILGVRLWAPTPWIEGLVRRTHWVGVGLAGLLCAHGILALQAAERSAAKGGGLLGGYGLFPLGIGIVLGITSGVSLWLMKRT
jgi:hypothetical protein